MCVYSVLYVYAFCVCVCVLICLFYCSTDNLKVIKKREDEFS